MTPKGHGVIRSRRGLLYDPKGHGCRFMTPKGYGVYDGVTGFMTPKGYGVIRGCHDLLYDPKGHRDLVDWFDLVYDPKRSRGH